MGALRSKDLPTWMNHFAVILIGPHQRRKTYWHIVGENDMPSDLARWTKIIPIPHPYYSTPSNHGLIGDSHILIVFFAQYVFIGDWFKFCLMLPPATDTRRHHSTPFGPMQASSRAAWSAHGGYESFGGVQFRSNVLPGTCEVLAAKPWLKVDDLWGDYTQHTGGIFFQERESLWTKQ